MRCEVRTGRSVHGSDSRTMVRQWGSRQLPFSSSSGQFGHSSGTMTSHDRTATAGPGLSRADDGGGGDGWGRGTNRSPKKQKKSGWKVHRAKVTLFVLLAFTTGFVFTSLFSRRFDAVWNLTPTPLSLAANLSALSSRLLVAPRLPLYNPAQNQDDVIEEGNFIDSESFRAFVKKQEGNFSSVAAYLSFVSAYLRDFRSPVLRETPSQYSWPETEGEKGGGRGGGGKSSAVRGKKRVVWYNAPSHMMNYAKENDPFSHCPVSDCSLSFNYKADHVTADAVVLHAETFKSELLRDHANQTFVFQTMESPHYTRDVYKHTTWNKEFNWTWNFRVDSDIFEPVGYLKRAESVPSHGSLLSLKRRKRKYVAWMSSHCNVQSKRDQYVKRLRKVIPVDIFGRCGNLTCKRGNRTCDTILDNYLFYLSFENSMCVDYITEKYYKTFMENVRVLPVVRGGGNYSRFFPKGTFIDAESFSSPEKLGRYLLELSRDDAAYVDMVWRKSHFLYHEHGIVDSYCQLCYKLHHLHRYRKSYPDMYGWYNNHGCSSPKKF